MQFQHTTQIQVAGNILRTTVSGSSGASLVLIPGTDSTLTVSIQQYLLTWSGVTTAGQISILAALSDPNPLVVYQTGAGGLVIPIPGETHNIGTYGLRAQNNSVGGSYSISTWYSVTLP